MHSCLRILTKNENKQVGTIHFDVRFVMKNKELQWNLLQKFAKKYLRLDSKFYLWMKRKCLLKPFFVPAKPY